MQEREDFFKTLTDAEVVIGYTPIGDEPQFDDFLKQNNVVAELFRLPPHREYSPHDTAQTLHEAYAGKRVCIFIPGREFDARGTRHGRGGGWYDRFLSEVPRGWLRTGILNTSQLSETPLTRESWDEPMDFLLIRERDSWSIVRVET